MMKTKLFLLFCLLAFMAGSTLYAQHSAQAVFSIEGTYDASGFLELVKEKTGCRIAYKESDLKNSRRVLLDYQKKAFGCHSEGCLRKIRTSICEAWKPADCQETKAITFCLKGTVSPGRERYRA